MSQLVQIMFDLPLCTYIPCLRRRRRACLFLRPTDYPQPCRKFHAAKMQGDGGAPQWKVPMLASPVPHRDAQMQRPPPEREDEAPVRVVVRSRPLNAIEKSDGCR